MRKSRKESSLYRLTMEMFLFCRLNMRICIWYNNHEDIRDQATGRLVRNSLLA